MPTVQYLKDEDKVIDIECQAFSELAALLTRTGGLPGPFPLTPSSIYLYK